MTKEPMTQDNKKEMTPTIQKQIEDETMREMACWETEVHIKNCPKCSKKYALDEIIMKRHKFFQQYANVPTEKRTQTFFADSSEPMTLWGIYCELEKPIGAEREVTLLKAAEDFLLYLKK